LKKWQNCDIRNHRTKFAQQRGMLKQYNLACWAVSSTALLEVCTSPKNRTACSIKDML